MNKGNEDAFIVIHIRQNVAGSLATTNKRIGIYLVPIASKGQTLKTSPFEK